MNANLPGTAYSPQNRVERIIVAGRLVLAAIFLLAIWLDPSQPTRHVTMMYVILTWYLAYSLVLFIATWRSYFVDKGTPFITHIIDLLVFAVILFLTEGPTSPFFVYFVFLLVCASLRWQWRGTLWTAGASLLTVIILAFYPYSLFEEPDFELHRFIIRIVYLAVMALLLGYVGAYDEKMRRDRSQIAAWPRIFASGLHSLLQGLIDHAAAILRAPRIVLLWEEKGEPERHLVSWSGYDIDYRQETPQETPNPPVAESLAETSFFCLNATVPQPSVVMTSPDGYQIVSCTPFHKQFQNRFTVKSALSVPLRGETMKGHLFALDKTAMNADDLVMGEIVAQKIAARLEQFFLVNRLRETAVTEERMRLARDLHDGMLQSLTVAALQLEVVHQRMETDPREAGRRLLELQKFIAATQRDLRIQINELKPPLSPLVGDFVPLKDRLADLAERTQLNGGPSIELHIQPVEPAVWPHLAQQIYLMIHEALTNAVKHAAASAVRIDLTNDEKQVRIVVQDNGRGFSFRGRYDGPTLARLGIGPTTLRERVASLKGMLTVESADTGATLEIALPLGEEGSLK